MNATKVDLMKISTKMHDAMVKDNQANKGVLKAARMGGWLSHRPTQKGLVPLEGDDWQDLPLGSSRLSKETVFLDSPACHSTSNPNPPPVPPFNVMSWGLLYAKKELRHSCATPAPPPPSLAPPPRKPSFQLKENCVRAILNIRNYVLF